MIWLAPKILAWVYAMVSHLQCTSTQLAKGASRYPRTDGEVSPGRLAVPAASPVRLGRRICAARGGNRQSLPPVTPAGAEQTAGELPKPTSSSGSTGRPGSGFPAHAARREASPKPPSIVPSCLPSRSAMGQISISNENQRVAVTQPKPARLMLRKRWQCCLRAQPRQPSARPPVPA